MHAEPADGESSMPVVGPAATIHGMAGTVKLADVARLAGVSQATASRALRGVGGMKSTTRERVVGAARELGYVTDPALRALAAYRAQVHERPGLRQLLLAVGSPYAPARLARSRHRHDQVVGVRAAAEALGYRLDGPLLLEDDDSRSATVSAAAVERLAQRLDQRQYAGVILAGVLPPTYEVAQLQGCAVVSLGNQAYAPRFHRVDSDCHHGMRLIFEHAIAAGRRRLGLYMHQHTDDSAGGLWTATFLHQARRHAESIATVPFCRQGGRQYLSDWLERHRPDCVISRVSIRAWLEDAGWRLGTDLGYLSLGVQAAGYRTSGLLSNAVIVGRTAVRILDMDIRHRWRGSPDHPLTTMVAYDWNEGQSLGLG